MLIAAPHAQAAPPPANGPLANAADVQTAIHYLENLGTVGGRFEQTDAHGRVESGRFLLQRPNKARFDYDPPADLSVIADGHKAFIVNARLRQLQSAPLSMTPLGLFLARRIHLDKGAQVTAVRERPGGFEVTAEATRSPTRGSITLDFARAPLRLGGWTITTGAGGAVKVRILEMEAAAPRPESYFDAHRRATELGLPE